MSALTELEIFSILFESFGSAAEKAETLAWNPRRGFVYREFLKEIKLIEGACTQAATWREDARWLTIGFMMGEVQRRAGNWLRNSPTKETRAEADKRFKKLAENLRRFAYECEGLRDKATGKLGIIVPEPLPGPHRDTRPVSVLMPKEQVDIMAAVRAQALASRIVH